MAEEFPLPTDHLSVNHFPVATPNTDDPETRPRVLTDPLANEYNNVKAANWLATGSIP
jgi:hypothetical protein